MDLLEYAQKLINKGNSSQQQQAHQLQAILQSSPIRNEQQPNNFKTPWLIGGGILSVSLALVVGYWWGKKRKDHELEN